jgi:hypothetical protein
VLTLLTLAVPLLQVRTPPATEAIDLQKFQALYRAGKAIEGSLAVGGTFSRFTELLQALATEVSIAKDIASTRREKQLLDVYTLALSTLGHGATVWRAKVDRADREAAEAGRELAIYYGHFSFDHPDDVQRTIWSFALEQLDVGSKVYRSDFAAAEALADQTAQRLSAVRGRRLRLDELVGSLRSDNQRERIFAAEQLGKLGSEAAAALPALEEAAAHFRVGWNSDARDAAKEAITRIKAAGAK